MKVAIITGAAQGIGRAIAEKFAGLGYFITIVDQDSDGLLTLAKALTEQYPVAVNTCIGNLSKFDFLQQIVQTTIAKWGHINALVNNAAWRTIGSMRNINIDDWQETLNVCLTAPAFLSKGCAEQMEKNSNPGVIVNISSVMANRAAGNSPAYIAAKGAMQSLTKELAVTYGRSGIRVLSVSPGYIATSLSEDYINTDGDNISQLIGDHLKSFTPLARPGSAEEIANAVCWLCSAEASFITGTDLLVDGGFSQNFTSYPIKQSQFPNEF